MTCIFSKVMIGLINAEVKLVDMGLPVRPLSLDGKTFSDIGRTLDISLYEDLVKTLPAGTERAALGVTWKGDPAVFIFDKNGEVRVQGETVIFMQPEGDDSIDTYIERVVKMNELLALSAEFAPSGWVMHSTVSHVWVAKTRTAYPVKFGHQIFTV
jgi:hypothetical protein